MSRKKLGGTIQPMQAWKNGCKNDNDDDDDDDNSVKFLDILVKMVTVAWIW